MLLGYLACKSMKIILVIILKQKGREYTRPYLFTHFWLALQWR